MDKNISKEDKTIQKVVNRMIANKIIQHCFYDGCMYSVKRDEKNVLDMLFMKIAHKKIDQYKAFVDYALENCYEIPVKLTEFDKFSDSKVYSCLNSLKKDQPVTYYVEKAVELEDAMIAAEQDISESDKDYVIPYSFMSIVYRCQSDDNECKEMLNSLADAYKAGADYMAF